MGACALDVNNRQKDKAAAETEAAFKDGGVLNALDILKADTRSICPAADGVNTMGYIGQKLSEDTRKALAPSVPNLELYDSKSKS